MRRRDFLHYVPLFSSFPVILSHIGRPKSLLQDDSDATICTRKFDLALSKSLQRKPVGEVIVEVGKSFIGTDYLAHTLEVPGEERLVVNLRGLDCVSFCENALVLARCVKKNATTFEDYKKELQFIRYRGGIIDQYPSRLHYFTDYIDDGERKRVWQNVTKEIGGKPYRKTINFMSTHSEVYRQLRENPKFIDVMERQEVEISKREGYYIPKSEVATVEQKIKDGDMLAMTTAIEGLDVSHTGIAVWCHSSASRTAGQNKRLHMLHAPDVGYKVTITELSLEDYLAKNQRQTGVIVARAVEPAVAK